MKLMILAALAAGVLCGCAPKEADTASKDAGTTTTSGESTPVTTASNTEQDKKVDETPAPAANTEDPATRKPKDGEEVAVMQTNLGKIVLMFFPDKAPGHVENFKKLSKDGFYNGTKFHRVIPGFMIQGGDPNSKDGDRSNDGQGNSGKYLKAEFNDVKHDRGILSMARGPSPDSASCQFFIVVAPAPHLDGGYSAFGKVVEGLDVVDKIVALPRDMQTNNPLPKNPATIEKITIEKWPLKK